MSSSQHPVALELERRVGGATRLLATVMALPLLDGIFPALVLAGALSTTTGILEVGLLIFGGSATVAVILAEMDGSPREQATSVALVGSVIVTVAVAEAALAPTIAGLLDLVVFKRFAALVILSIAAHTASSRLGEWLPRPAIIIGLGLVASLDPAGATVALQTDLALMARAAAASGVGVLFALGIALTSPWLRNAVDIDRFRFGSAVALGVLPLGFFGLIPGDAPVALAVLGITTLLSVDPQRARERDQYYEPDTVDMTAAFSDGGASQGVSHDDPDSEPHRIVEYDGEDRAPWL